MFKFYKQEWGGGERKGGREMEGGKEEEGKCFFVEYFLRKKYYGYVNILIEVSFKVMKVQKNKGY